MRIIPIITVLSLVIVIPIFLMIYSLYFTYPIQYFSQQAQSILQGKLDIPIAFDTIQIGDKNYLAKDPFPVLLILPFIFILGPSINEFHLQIFLTISLAWAVYRLSRIHEFNKEDSFYLTYAFLGGSVMLGLIMRSSFYAFAEITSTLLLVLLVTEYLTKRNYFLMGSLLACIITTRFPAGFILFPILFTLFTEKNPGRIRNSVVLLSPILIAVCLVMAFNYIRFGTLFFDVKEVNNGEWLIPLRDMGVLSLVHIPTNFYDYFISGLEPVFQEGVHHLTFPYITVPLWGTGFFTVSPFFVLAFRSLKNKQRQVQLLWLTCFATLFFLLCFYSSGADRFGPRYMADLLPILFYLLLISFKPRKLHNWHKILICCSAVLNAYLLLSTYIIKS